MQQKMKRAVCLIASVMLLCSSFTVRADEEQVKVTDKEYVVTLSDALNLYMSNDKPVSGEVGSKVFLTYTVEKVTKNTTTQNGIVGTTDNTAEYPYLEKGRLCFENQKVLYEEGYTYVFRFERTADGFEYQCAKLKGKESQVINFSAATEGPETEAYTYYGTWIGGGAGEGVSAVLNHVRCYDEKGNDLGIHFNASGALVQNQMNELLDVHMTVDSTYSFTLEDARTVLISNKYGTQSDTVYMEYEVKNVTQDDTYQQGLMATSTPKIEYPHGNGTGYLQVKVYEKGQGETPLLKEGGKYFICFNRKEDGFDGIIQCTRDGKTETSTFSYAIGTYRSNYPYFSLWLGEGPAYGVSAEFHNFKCYDANGNSLGVQLNQKNISISHKGGLEDYSKSHAVYYCKENNGFVTLQDKNMAVRQIQGVKEECTYRIQDDTSLYLMFEEGKIVYDYTYLKVTDEEENVYRRLKESTVTFVTGAKTKEVRAKAENGFRVEEPEAPTMEGNTFKGWYLGNGEAFDFDTVVTEGTILYAKWQDGDGNEYLAVSKPLWNDINVPMVTAISASAVILLGSIVGCTIIIRRRKR